jgi:hypothetical protein
MKRGVKWLENRLEFCLGVLLVVLLLPLLALAVVVLRGVLFVAAIAALIAAALLYGIYPRFRHWADQLGHAPPRLRVR